jgi:hypothetical protein
MSVLKTTPSPEASPTQSGPAAQASPEPEARETTATKQQAAHRQRRPWFKKKRVGLPATVALMFLILMITTGGNDPRLFDHTTSPLESSAERANGVAMTGAIGQSVRDGSFAFVVSSAQRPTKTFIDRFGTAQTAQGMYVIVRFSVTNIGYDPRSLRATDQFLINTSGQRYATSAAITFLQGTEQVFVAKINPGQTVDQAPLLFDVAPGTTISTIELHDSATSNGVRVKLS